LKQKLVSLLSSLMVEMRFSMNQFCGLLITLVIIIIIIVISIITVSILLLPLLRRSTSGEGIVVLGVCVSIRRSATACRNDQPQLHVRRCPSSRNCRRVALVSAAKVMRCIQCSLVTIIFMTKQTSYMYSRSIKRSTCKTFTLIFYTY